ncbi:glycosyltransferase [Porphyromonas gingivalis]|uniref:glycosyltransferase n=1 Tax=Porphyromonas gingivalis TaxID=837 RepID=UPI0003AD5FAC|nr:glycosyltransferase [Porphyromonas gingivalis]ERJ69170.1 glycosyltransferase, group 2 family protein [Porphyromonas gingivalis F0568]MCE8188169.1 glycosyltransferase [Porphyromonas gingivalis]
MIRIDVVLPAYRPSQGWEREAISRLTALSDSIPDVTFRIFIVPDGSNDGHSDEVRSHWATSPWEVIYCDYAKNRGKGFAVRYGVGQTDAPFVLYTDYDLPFTLDSYKQVIEALLEGADVVISRREPESYGKKIRLKRKMLSDFSHFVNKFFFLPTTDTQGGLKGFSSTGRFIFLQTRIDSFLFDTEFICLAKRKKVCIAVVSGSIRPDISLSVMKAKTILREVYKIPKLIKARWFS